MKVKRIVTNIEASTLDSASRFYADLFGLELLMDNGWIRTYGSGEQMSVQISVATEGGSGTPVADLSIEVDELDAALIRVREAGIFIEYGPELEAWGVVLSDKFKSSTRTWVPPSKASKSVEFKTRKNRLEITNKRTTTDWFGTHTIKKLANSSGWSIESSISMIARDEAQGNGLVFGNSQQQILFLLKGSGSYKVESVVNGNRKDLTGWRKSGVIKLFNRSRNRFRVDSSGGKTKFYVNDTALYETTKYTSNMDRVGFYVGALSKMRINNISVSGYR